MIPYTKYKTLTEEQKYTLDKLREPEQRISYITILALMSINLSMIVTIYIISKENSITNLDSIIRAVQITLWVCILLPLIDVFSYLYELITYNRKIKQITK